MGEEREEMPEQKREAVELLASSNVVGGSYVPPHMRGQAGAAAAAAATEVRRLQPRGRVMKAPDISSEVYFPSLVNSEDSALRELGANLHEVEKVLSRR